MEAFDVAKIAKDAILGEQVTQQRPPHFLSGIEDALTKSSAHFIAAFGDDKFIISVTKVGK